jgi:hypothetical protein
MDQTVIIERLKRVLSRKSDHIFCLAQAPLKDDMGALPPFSSLTAALTVRVRTWRAVCLVVSVVLLAVIAGQQVLLQHKLFAKTNEQYIIVPGAPEFFRVRPGLVPDESVFVFAEYVAAHLGHFSGSPKQLMLSCSDG